MSSVRQQQWSAKNIFCKQKSIEDKSVVDPSDSQSIGRKILRKQLSVDHVTSTTQHASKSDAPVNLSNLLWQNSTNEPNLRIVTSNAIKKRAQFAASANNSISKQELFKTMMKNASGPIEANTGGTKARDKININIFLSQDLADDGCSDNETISQNAMHKQGASSSSSSSNVALKSSVSSGTSEATPTAANGKLSASARRAQFQSRRIMSAPIRPMLNDDSKGKRKPRKKKVIRVNLTLNRDKDIDESPDEYAEELEEFKQPIQASVNQKSSTKKHPPMRSRSILGCDQMGIETLVSMLNSGESDSEKEDAQQAPPPPPLPAVKTDSSRIRANMLRKTEDDSQLQAASVKDPFNFRRNSVVPFAGRMRNTRSLFGQEIVNLYMNNTNNNNINSPTTMTSINAKNNNNGDSSGSSEMSGEVDKNENDLNSSNQQQELTKEKPKAKKLSDDLSDERKSQDSMTEPRELECWRLYEKMKKTGLNISYDTILRGILKPSELRLLEKQKKLLGDIEERTIDDCDELKSEDGP